MRRRRAHLGDGGQARGGRRCADAPAQPGDNGPVRALAVVAVAVLVSVGVSIAALAAADDAASATLTGGGIAGATFGQPKGLAVAAITALLGQPTAEQESSGCGPRYSEVEWGDLAAEFRLGRFSGYRYLDGGLLGDHGSIARLESLPVAPRLFTRGGITLGSTLGEVRAAFGALRTVGTNRSEASDGLVFYDDAEIFPDPPSARIVEMKIGTCGDY